MLDHCRSFSRGLYFLRIPRYTLLTCVECCLEASDSDLCVSTPRRRGGSPQMYNALMYILRNAVTLPASTVFPGPAGRGNVCQEVVPLHRLPQQSRLFCTRSTPSRASQLSRLFCRCGSACARVSLLHPHASVLIGAFRLAASTFRYQPRSRVTPPRLGGHHHQG